MANNFKFEDNSKKVKKLMAQTNEAAMESILLMVEGQAKSLARTGSGELRDKIDHKITEQDGNLIGQVGSPHMHAIYNEFGTGEFAENGNGRKGGWVYRDPSGEYFFTYGLEPQPFLRPAFRRNKGNIKKIVGNEYGASFKGK
ncbi:phage protein, HK97 gp10 family [Alkalibacterium putridalgicola]|uniref:Phage protein, HK97 gp10 family n=1 Tax=Alkalibacterium putridalgicola TaxID=426703 RepID=A0A1H7RKU5_9LACT|nr:HK97-gp10 family putative phage morphogenesis protein [Alkalibacterium putridalgicola]GEK88885.1 hypothetical protein APU01nite_09240 [Alkalibacterium putridalgicola]SEL60725.1 phage protein, HK97 gp10 family [Alkalibacterium putridalgicola]